MSRAEEHALTVAFTFLAELSSARSSPITTWPSLSRWNRPCHHREGAEGTEAGIQIYVRRLSTTWLCRRSLGSVPMAEESKHKKNRSFFAQSSRLVSVF